MTSLVKQLKEKTKDELIELMHSEIASLALEGAESLRKFKHAGCLLFINLGIKIDQVLSKDMISDVDGEVTKLAYYWGFSHPQQLYDWRKTALAFCPRQVELSTDDNGKEVKKVVYDTTEVKKLLTTAGFEFEHFKQLALVDNSKKRKSLMKETIKNNWSAGDLSREIAGSGVQKTNVRGGGRPPAIPTTAAQFMSKSYRESQKLTNFFEAGRTEVVTLFQQIATDKVDDAFIERLQDTREQCKAAAAAALEMADALLEAEGHVEQVLANTREQEE